MRPLPPVPPSAGFTAKVRLPRDYYLRVLGNDYSIDPAVIGRMVEIHAGLDAVTARFDDILVASHPRSWARRQTITDPVHVAAAARLRAGYQQPRQAGDDSGLVRDLADYDARFGIDFDTTGNAGLDAEAAV